jgi:oligoendopeptidase F
MEINNKIFYSLETASLPVREEIKEEYKWDLSHIYNSDAEWEIDFKWVAENINSYNKYKGRLAEGTDVLLNCLKLDDEIGKKIERLYLYAMLSKDSDMKVGKYQAMNDRIRNLYSKVAAAGSFIRPEILSIPDEKLFGMIDSNEDLRVYRHMIDDLVRTRTHTLTQKEEELLALSSEMGGTAHNTFSIFTNVDLKFPVVPDENGDEVEISHARFYAALYSNERRFRRDAFKAYLGMYKDYVNTFSSLLNGNLKTHIFYSKARNYSSAREAALNKNNIPVSVYDNLVSAVNNNLAPLHRWASLKKKLLGIPELHPYDLYVSIFPATTRKYSYEEAKTLVSASLQPLGADYLLSLTTAFNNRWIDVYETQSKKSGAYSSGTTFGVHPYVLLNWTDLLNDVFTLAHEMGHNMHSYYTGMSQPYVYANYSIFLAEVASTFNESLLLEYMISKAENREEKLFLLEKYLNNITATFYRQVMFAEYEMKIYSMTEKGEALTPDILRAMYKEIYTRYWGPELVMDEQEEFTWARIPHFYYNFYVYQYATGFAASEVLAEKVKKEGDIAVSRYLEFLKSGSSDYPINILERAGVNMNSPEPVIATTRKMNALLDLIEELAAEK